MPLLFVVVGVLVLFGALRFFSGRDARDITLFFKVFGVLVLASMLIFLLLTGRWVVSFLILLVLFPFVPWLKKNLKRGPLKSLPAPKPKKKTGKQTD